ncbi:MAG: triphosphoribosyl-dephospho-CoA synthase [Candidatus Bathyarchaeia archaeon]|jgi:triphosphoribosyl-dephospho-CoA synthase
MFEAANNVSKCLELAILLEASAHKPGNVSVVTNFESTRYEHFLASAVAARSSFEYATERGIAVHNGKSPVANVNVGQIIKNCVTEIDHWQHGGNTLLGTVILLSPMAVAAGMTMSRERFDVSALRKNLKLVVESTTAKDAVDVYEAIRIANPSGLGKAPELDVNDPTATERIIGQKISLYEVFKIAEKYDTICSEWTKNYPVTFDLAYPSLADRLRNSSDPSLAIVQTFLQVLAEVPDTFIARKTSIEKARQISLKAREVIELGGVETSSGRKSLDKLDGELKKSSNLLNPGTTADIIGAALALCILAGYRP